MNMNKAFFLRKEDRKPQWKLIDATGKTVGRLTTQIADMLRGKDKPYYTPHTDGGDYVVVINADKVVFTGKKWQDKQYDRYTGWMGGYKVTSAQDMKAKHPDHIIRHAVKGMLPKNKLSNAMLKKLKVYADDKHPHVAQNVQVVSL